MDKLTVTIAVRISKRQEQMMTELKEKFNIDFNKEFRKFITEHYNSIVNTINHEDSNV